MLECISKVSNGQGAWLPGHVVDDPKIEDWLLRDSPGSWKAIGVKPVAPDPDPAPDEPALEDTAIHEAPEDKAIPHRGPGRPRR